MTDLDATLVIEDAAPAAPGPLPSTPDRGGRLRDAAATLAPAIVTFAAVAVGSIANGSSEPSHWGFAAGALFVVAAIGAIASRFAGGTLDRMLAGGLLGYLPSSAIEYAWPRSSAPMPG